MNRPRFHPQFHPLACAAFAALVIAPAARAQQVPDAGQILRQLTPSQVTPRESRPLDLQAPAAAPTPPGGAQVQVKAIQFAGHTALETAELSALLADAIGQQLDLAGLRGLAERVTARYREAGYPFARAFLPAQEISQGVVRIEIVEGRFGRVQVRHADAKVAEQAQAFLARLQPDTVITSQALERSTLLLSDLPGVSITPVMRPGQKVGTGDLDVAVELDERRVLEAGYDNHGGRYSGYHRLSLGFKFSGALRLGDQVALRALVSDDGLWLGSASYAMPLGGDGWRAQVAHAHTSYELGRDFSQLGATGLARVTSAGVTRALVRSQQFNLSWGLTWQHKHLRDERASTSTSERKRSDSLPMSLQFDRRDSLGQGGITFGALTWTPGRLRLDPGMVAGDVNSTRGGFSKFNLELTRIQALAPTLNASARLQAQWAGHNLDSSEKMALGGPAAVRAYPSGEGNGDEAWLAQFELRQPSGSLLPYAFYDMGRVRALESPAAGQGNAERKLAGAGVGVRHQAGRWSVDAALAWRTRGGKPETDGGRDDRPRLWLSASGRF